MRNSLTILLFTCFVPLRAAAQPATTQSSATPRGGDAPALIRQLGDDDAKVRNAAAKAIKDLGKSVLPALKEAAAKDDDPQIRTSAQALVVDIEGGGLAAATRPALDRDEMGNVIVRRGPFGIPGGGGGIRVMPGAALRVNGANQLRISVQNNNGVVVRDITSTENGRQVHIHEDPDALTVDVTENGETKQYKARNAAELKEKEPEAFRYYEKYGQAGGVIRVEGR